MSPRPVMLVGCGRQKAPQACMAQELYTSYHFQLCRQYAERFGDSWYIMSAKHGLVLGATILEPYEQALTDGDAASVARWAMQVAQGVLWTVPIRHPIHLLAGKTYNEPLVVPLASLGYTVVQPFGGLGIGRRIKRLRHALAINLPIEQWSDQEWQALQRTPTL